MNHIHMPSMPTNYMASGMVEVLIYFFHVAHSFWIVLIHLNFHIFSYGMSFHDSDCILSTTPK